MASPSSEPSPYNVNDIFNFDVCESSDSDFSSAAPPSSKYGSGRRFLIYNPLSRFWTRENFSKNPAKFILLSPLVYMAGAAGYGLSLTIRILIVGLTTLRFVVTCFEPLVDGQFRALPIKLQMRGFIVLGSVGEVFSAVIGMVCPIVAYRIDEGIQHKTVVNNWYSKWLLSCWSQPEVRAEFKTGFTPDILSPHFVKKNRDYFQDAKDSISTYGSEFVATDIEVHTMILAVGFLYAIEDRGGQGLHACFKPLFDKETNQHNCNKLNLYLTNIEKTWQAIGEAQQRNSKSEGFKELKSKELVRAIEMALFIALCPEEDRGGFVLQKFARAEEKVTIDGKTVSMQEAVERLQQELKLLSQNIESGGAYLRFAKETLNRVMYSK